MGYVSYTRVRPPVRGDNPGALASGSSYLGTNLTVLLGLRSYVQLDKHGITIFYYLNYCRRCTLWDIFVLKVGRCGKSGLLLLQTGYSESLQF